MLGGIYGGVWWLSAARWAAQCGLGMTWAPRRAQYAATMWGPVTGMPGSGGGAPRAGRLIAARS
jgi:hypothetical protein